jgi:hypothetical protein
LEGGTETESEHSPYKFTQLPPLDPRLRQKDKESRLASLWTVYEAARTDYMEALAEADEKKVMPTAKFVRDTAENILLHVQNKTVDDAMLAELQNTFEHAKYTVVCMTGGRKRKFDAAEIEQVQGIPRGPMQQSILVTGGKSGPKPHTRDRGYGHLAANPYKGVEKAHETRRFDEQANIRNNGYGDHPRWAPPGERELVFHLANQPVMPDNRNGLAWETTERRDRSTRRRSYAVENNFSYAYEVTRSGADCYRPRGYEQGGRSILAGSERRRDLRSASPGMPRVERRGESDMGQGRRGLRDRFDRAQKGGRHGHGGTRSRPMHSDIAFGYSADRVVDSYVPGMD